MTTLLLKTLTVAGFVAASQIPPSAPLATPGAPPQPIAECLQATSEVEAFLACVEEKFAELPGPGPRPGWQERLRNFIAEHPDWRERLAQRHDRREDRRDRREDFRDRREDFRDRFEDRRDGRRDREDFFDRWEDRRDRREDRRDKWEDRREWRKDHRGPGAL